MVESYIHFLGKWVDQIPFGLPRDSSFNFEHFDILWASNEHSYQKLYPFEVKKKFRKKAFRQYEWRDPPRGQQLANSTGESTRRCHVSNSPTPLASSLQKQTPPGKSFKTAPFWELVSKRDLVWAICLIFTFCHIIDQSPIRKRLTTWLKPLCLHS